MQRNAYVPIHKDLATVKTKVFFNLTARQFICFGSGILVGLPLFFLLNKVLSGSAATVIMICVMLPFFLFAMYERNGQPLEKVLRYYIHSRFVRPKKRPYRTENVYSALMRQAKLEKEVRQCLTSGVIARNDAAQPAPGSEPGDGRRKEVKSIVQGQRKQKRSQGETDQS